MDEAYLKAYALLFGISYPRVLEHVKQFGERSLRSYHPSLHGGEDGKRLFEAHRIVRAYLEREHASDVLDRPELVARYVLSQIDGVYQEQLACIYLSVRNRPLHFEVVSKGGVNTSLAPPDAIFRRAITEGAVKLIVAHNHPSDVVNPSKEDERVTERLAAAGRLLGIELIDHVIVTPRGSYLSLREHHPELFDPALPSRICEENDRSL